MQPRLLGIIQGPGVIESACLLTHTRIAVVMRRRNAAEVIGADFRAPDRLIIAWSHPLDGGGHHNWAGHDVAMNVSSLVPSETEKVIAVGGTARVLLDGATGTVIAASSPAADASPTAPSAIVGSRLLVPEGRSIAAYSTDSLARLERRDISDGYWAWAPPTGGLIPLEHEWDASGLLLNWDNGSVWEVPDARYFRGGAVSTPTTVLVPGGLFATETLSAIGRDDGSVRWRIEFSPTARSSSDTRRSLYFPISPAADGAVIAATAAPAIDSINSDTGRPLWSLGLEVDATALAIHDGGIWVGSADGALIVADVQKGIAREQAKLDLRDGIPASILPVDDHTAMVITRLGLIYRWSI